MPPRRRSYPKLAKRMSDTASRRRWRVVLLRAKGEILGTVEAPNMAAAKAAAAVQFHLDEIRRRGRQHGHVEWHVSSRDYLWPPPPHSFDADPQFGADIMALGESDAMNKLADYAARGRSHKGLSERQLTNAWKAAFEKVADDPRIHPRTARDRSRSAQSHDSFKDTLQVGVAASSR